MKWKKLSKKQLQLLTWWNEESPYKNYSGIIAEGSIRSGKSLVMSFSFVLWSMSNYNKQRFAICGKTISSLRRNVIQTLKEVLTNRGYKVIDKVSENELIVSDGKSINTYYLFGGRDERSQDLIQGITLAGIFFDEVALMPRSFVEQGMGRCSVDGSKYWFDCNPEGPSHWFYKEIVLKAEEKKLFRIHFMLEDNLSLSQEIVDRYKSMFSGVFYKRFILGEWAFSDGIVYDCFDEKLNCYTNEERSEVLPIQALENDPFIGSPYYGCDYGVYNPFALLKAYKFYKKGDKVPYIIVDDEFYYDGRKSMQQKADSEYVDYFERFNNNLRYNAIIIDPSASSLDIAFEKRGHKVMKADNSVYEGIKMVYSLLKQRHILINKDNCKNLLNEIVLYIWNDKLVDKGREEVVKANDHVLDALRYIVKTTINEYEVFN